MAILKALTISGKIVAVKKEANNGSTLLKGLTPYIFPLKKPKAFYIGRLLK